MLPIDDDHLTEAARRALERARESASRASAAEVLPLHLLAALAEGESQATELLRRHGVRSAEDVPRATAEPATGDAPLVVEPLPGTLLQSVLDRARRALPHGSCGGQVGTGHLLYGLAVVESPAAAHLRDRGFDAAAAEAVIEMHSEGAGEPLEVDVELHPPDPARIERQRSCRIVDAAANRAREAFRVAEDYVRFTLDDRQLVTFLKEARHDFAKTMQAFDPVELVHARDTMQDVGTDVSTAGERTRQSGVDVVRAALKRLQESLRTLEEYGKLLAPVAAGAFEDLRYRSYTLEKLLLTNLAGRRAFEDRLVYLLVTAEKCRHDVESTVREALSAGAGVVQLREKTLPDRELLSLAERMREWTRDAGALLIVNDRPDVAVLCEADGVHVGQEEFTVAQARRIVGPDRLVGVSTHDVDQARQAVRDGADYLGVGPVFHSGTKAFDAFPGLEFVRAVAAEITLPWFAIGGIGPENVARVLEAGAQRVAVSGAVCGAEHPREVTCALVEALRMRSRPERS